MRIHDVDNDRTIKNSTVYLTTSEAAELLGLLYDLLNKPNVKQATVNDADFEHILKFHIYSQFEMSGFDRRQKTILAEDI